MGLTVNTTAAAAEGLYTGVTTLKVVGVNLRREELIELGYPETIEEPSYRGEDKNKEQYTLVRFYLERPVGPDQPALLATCSFFLYDKDTSLHINRYGRFAGEDKRDKLGDCWPAKTGEVDMMKFLEPILAVKKDQDFFLDYRANLFEDGYDEELRAEVTKAKGNKVKGCLGIRNEQYQVIYPFLMNVFKTDYLPLWNEMFRQKDHLRDYYGPVSFTQKYAMDMFRLREFTGEPEEEPVAEMQVGARAVGPPPKKLVTTGPPKKSAPAAAPQDDDEDPPF